jgi:acetyl-CoA carboxylase biotin carboxylase subunit
VYTGYRIPPYYDSMIAKLIVKARTREDAVIKMRHSLEEFVIEGVPTTIPFHKEIFRHPDFVAGKYDINFIETKFRPKAAPQPTEEPSAVAEDTAGAKTANEEEAEASVSDKQA